jgi:hypothetical protein
MFRKNHSNLFSRVNYPWTALPLKMVPIRCPETSVPNYHFMLRNNPEERSSLLHRGGSLKSHMKILFPVNEPLKYLISIFGKCSTNDKIIYCKAHLFICYEFPLGKVNVTTPLKHFCHLPLLFKTTTL